MQSALKVILLLLSSAALCSCSRSGPVLRPDPVPVVLPPMPAKPQPKGVQAVRQDLLLLPTQTRP